eukprot:scaffold130736_cov69-Phaeocystis_antarctica.AAC.1
MPCHAYTELWQAVDSCKASFDYTKLATLNALLAQTFEAMDERSGLGAPHPATALQAAQAEAMAELARQKRSSMASSSSVSSSSERISPAGKRAARPSSERLLPRLGIGERAGSAGATAASAASAAGAGAGADEPAPLPAASLFVAGLDDV